MSCGNCRATRADPLQGPPVPVESRGHPGPQAPGPTRATRTRTRIELPCAYTTQGWWGVTDHYEVLGVSAQAPDDVIRAAYKARIRQTHPDSGGQPGEAQQVNEAYAILSDPARRALYDSERTPVPPAVTTPADALNAETPTAAKAHAPAASHTPIQRWWRRASAMTAGATWLLVATAVTLIVAASSESWTYAVIGAAAAATSLWSLSASRWKIAAVAVVGLGAMSLAIPGLLPMSVLLGTSVVSGLMIRSAIGSELDELAIAQVDAFWRTLGNAHDADAWFAEDVAPEGNRTKVLLQQLDGQARTTRSLWGTIAQGTYLLLTSDDEPLMSLPHGVMERAGRDLKRREHRRRG